MKFFIRLIFILFLLSGNILSAENDMNLVLGLEKRLTNALNVFDPNGSVYIDYEIKNENVNLPMIPFVFNISEIKNDGNTQFKELNITVLSKFDKIPEELNKIFNSITKKYNKSPTILMVKASPSVIGESSIGINWQDYISEFIILGGMFLGLMFLAFHSRGMKESGRLLRSEIGDQVSKLSNAIENSSNSGSSTVESSSASQSGSFEINTSSSSIWDQFSNDSILSLLADCYWCYEDQYASFIWSKVSINKRSELVDKLPYLSDYVDFISTVDAVDKHYENDPFYLSPLPINHLSNDDLTIIIHQHPGVLGSVSKIREKLLPIKAKEYIELNAKRSNPFDVKVLQEAKNSENRTIKIKSIFVFSSIEEETEIVSMENIDIDTMENFPSLAWVTKLRQNDIKSILDNYSAKDLARVWIAPEDTLSKLEMCLPDKKADLLREYKEKTTASRQAPIYHAIINLALSKLRERELERTSESKAA